MTWFGVYPHGIELQAAALRARARHQREQTDREDRDKRREQQRAEGQDELIDVMAGALVAAERQTAFTMKLDRYDTATVQAFTVNETKLELARAELETVRLEAHILPDGRRVFRTEAGDRVFDEAGVALDMEIIAPDEIGPHRPSWEIYLDKRDTVQAFEAEREELFAYQDKLDDARDRLDDDEFTEAELNELEVELDAAMPDAVRAQLGFKASQNLNDEVDTKGHPETRVNAIAPQI